MSEKILSSVRPRKARLVDMTHSLLGMVLLGQPNLRFEFDTMVSPKNSKSACFGKPRSFHFDYRWKTNWWTTSWWEKSRWKWNDEIWGFYSLKIQHPRSGNYCVCGEGGGVHTHSVSHAHFLDTFFFFAWRTNIAHTHGSRCLPYACQISSSHLFPSHVSFTVFVVPAQSPRHFVPVCTFLAELFPIRKAQVKRTPTWAPRSLATWPIRRPPQMWGRRPPQMWGHPATVHCLATKDEKILPVCPWIAREYKECLVDLRVHATLKLFLSSSLCQTSYPIFIG